MISFRPFNCESIEDCALMAKWQNNPEIRHLFNFFANEEATKKFVTVEEVAARWGRWQHERKNQYACWLILKNDIAVGEINYSFTDPQLLTKLSGTAWAGIAIGEATARGCGIGEQAMHYLEAQIQAAGGQRIELGVFEFNHTAVKFYQKLNYREIARLPDFAYWQGKKWTDIRLLKEL